METNRTDTNRTIEIRASYRTSAGKGNLGPQTLEVAIYTATAEGAQAIAAMFPKAAKMRPTKVGSLNGDYGMVRMWVDLRATGSTGTANETGLRRYRTLRKAAEKLGFTVVWTTPFSNSYPTEADFESAIANA